MGCGSSSTTTLTAEGDLGGGETSLAPVAPDVVATVLEHRCAAMAAITGPETAARLSLCRNEASNPLSRCPPLPVDVGAGSNSLSSALGARPLSSSRRHQAPPTIPMKLPSCEASSPSRQGLLPSVSCCITRGLPRRESSVSFGDSPTFLFRQGGGAAGTSPSLASCESISHGRPCSGSQQGGAACCRPHRVSLVVNSPSLLADKIYVSGSHSGAHGSHTMFVSSICSDVSSADCCLSPTSFAAPNYSF